MAMIKYVADDSDTQDILDVEKLSKFIGAIQEAGIAPESMSTPEIASAMIGVANMYKDTDDVGAFYGLIAICIDIVSNDTARKALSKDERRAVATALELLCSVAARHTSGMIIQKRSA